MAYEKQKFADGQILKAEHLEKMEDGIIAAVLTVNGIAPDENGNVDAEALPTAVDFSAFDSDGTIVETFADGSSKTTTVEFDANGTPVKITDGNGNVTTLTW